MRQYFNPVKRALMSMVALALCWTTVAVTPASAQRYLPRNGPTRPNYSADATLQASAKPSRRPVVSLQVSDEIYAALTKVYGNPKLQVPIAKALVKNNGDQPIKNVQVRFNLAGFTLGWGPWQQQETVSAGQAIAFSFHPVLDAEKMGRLTGTNPATLEMEAQYETAAGQVVKKASSRPVKVLSRNEVFTRGPALKIFLASLVTAEDPLIKQAAGWVCKLEGGVNAQGSDEEALKFMSGVYYFMAANIAYQTPPGKMLDGRFFQNIKFGRDVFRDKAGTCVDLAILYASMCEAVGLKPVLFLVPGHCFVGVILPSGKLQAVEATGAVEANGKRLNFDDACIVGQNEAKPVLSGTKGQQIDIGQLRVLGVISMELPSLPPSTLNDYNIRPVKAEAPSHNPKIQPAPSTVTPARPAPQTAPPASAAGDLVGKWGGKVTLVTGEEVGMGAAFDLNGKFAIVVMNSRGQIVKKLQGYYTYRDGVLTLHANGGERLSGRIQWLGTNRLVLDGQSLVRA